MSSPEEYRAASPVHIAGSGNTPILGLSGHAGRNLLPDAAYRSHGALDVLSHRLVANGTPIG